MARPSQPLRPRLRSTRRALLASGLAVPFLAILALPWVAAGESGSELRVIVHPDNPRSHVEREFLAQAFLKNVTRWRDGEAIRPVDLHPESPTRKRFSQSVLRRTVSAVKSYWQQRIFSGRGVPPPELDSEQAVVAYVMRYRGAVGYISRNTELAGAKVLAID